ncbi:hypothetical protein NPIL_492701 [Nephila pilipes]|uniref:Uncharacterized protein n=1 Tax=Nephila pilipes TaxID=299642 RepID=A0A8X6TGJ1_NEPPI|nr:hypothetical protein NPIL_492701 [Nephila pilipes]
MDPNSIGKYKKEQVISEKVSLDFDFLSHSEISCLELIKKMPNNLMHSLGNVRSDMDISYPEPLSRLNRHMVLDYIKPISRGRRHNRARSRYRTQPITFYEILEVDEENSAPLESKEKEPTSPIAGSLPKKFTRDLMKLKTLANKRKSPRSIFISTSASEEELNLMNGGEYIDKDGKDQAGNNDEEKQPGNSDGVQPEENDAVKQLLQLEHDRKASI